MTQPAIKSAQRVFEVFEYFDRMRQPLALKDVVREFGYPASSGSVLLKSLVALGYLQYDKSRRTYFPTMRIAAIGSWVPGALFGESAIVRVMEDLHRATKETVILAAQSDLDAQYIHVIHAGEPLQRAVQPGTRRPLAYSGMGWLFLSAKPSREIEVLRRRINAATGSRLTQIDLTRRIHDVRACGYAFSKGTVSKGAGIIAVLLPENSSGRQFALGVGGPIAQLEPRERNIFTLLKAALKQLSIRT